MLINKDRCKLNLKFKENCGLWAVFSRGISSPSPPEKNHKRSPKIKWWNRAACWSENWIHYWTCYSSHTSPFTILGLLCGNLNFQILSQENNALIQPVQFQFKELMCWEWPANWRLQGGWWRQGEENPRALLLPSLLIPSYLPGTSLYIKHHGV